MAIIELKLVTPETTVRLDRAVEQLRNYEEEYIRLVGGPKPDLVLVVPGVIPPDRVDELTKAGLSHVFDGPALRSAAPTLPWPDEVAGAKIEGESRSGDSARTDHPLQEYLETIPPGRPGWSAYQRAVRDILAETLCPPLSQPLEERANLSGVNRRDIIFPNYAADGLWKFLRDHYDAHYIVVEAKNYVGGVKKKEILQIANYLSSHGAGLFGIVVCRNAADRSAEVTRREQWVIYKKLIIVLNDADLKQMLALSMDGEDPANVIRQKLEDFRLGF